MNDDPAALPDDQKPAQGDTHPTTWNAGTAPGVSVDSCPTCGTPMEVGQRFCTQCGALRHASSPSMSYPASRNTALAWWVGAAALIATIVAVAATSDSGSSLSSPSNFNETATSSPTTDTFEAPTTTSGVLTTPPTTLTGSAATWTISGSDNSGYSAKVTIGADTPIKTSKASTSAVGRGLLSCTADASTDALIPIHIQETNTTTNFPTILGIRLSAPNSGPLTLVGDVKFSSGPVCQGSSSDNQIYSVQWNNPIGAGAAATDQFFVVVHNYYSPAHPDGDTASLGQVTLQPVITFGDTNGSNSRNAQNLTVSETGSGPSFSILSSGSATTPTTLGSRQGTNHYSTTADLQLRSAPATSANSYTVVPNNTSVVVQCTEIGETVDGPYGPDVHWDRVSYGGYTGYLSDEYVDTRNDVLDPTKIPGC